MVLKNLERVNEYDYNNMLHDFKADEIAEQRYKQKVSY